MKSLITLTISCFLLSSIHGAYVNQTSTREQASGEWSHTLEGNDEFSDKPEQYVLCGYSLLTENWNTTVNNCNCGYTFFRGEIRWRCNPCVNQLETKNSGFSAVFCHYQNWNDKRSKNVTSNSSNAGRWMNTTSCPSNYYSTAFTPKFGSQYNNNLGLTGFSLQCSTLNLASSETIEDNGIGRKGPVFKPNPGNFITSVKVKLESGGVLTGLQSQYEGLPVITNVKITYYPYVEHNSVPVSIDSLTVSNCANTTANQTVKFDKSYEIISIWRTTNNYTKSLQSRPVIVEPPKLESDNSGGSSGTPSTYKASTQQFAMEKVVKTILSSGAQTFVLVPPQRQVTVNTMIQEQKGDLPYIATITVCNLYNGEFLMEYTVEGKWEGTMISSAKTLITENAATCKSTESPSSNPTPVTPVTPTKPNPSKPNPTPNKNLKRV